MTDQPTPAQPPAREKRDLDLRFLLRAGSIVILLGVFLAFALQNSENVEVEFLWWSFETPQILLLVGSALVGILVWELAGLVRRRRKQAG